MQHTVLLLCNTLPIFFLPLLFETSSEQWAVPLPTLRQLLCDKLPVCPPSLSPGRLPRWKSRLCNQTKVPFLLSVTLIPYGTCSNLFLWWSWLEISIHQCMDVQLMSKRRAWTLRQPSWSPLCCIVYRVHYCRASCAHPTGATLSLLLSHKNSCIDCIRSLTKKLRVCPPHCCHQRTRRDAPLTHVTESADLKVAFKRLKQNFLISQLRSRDWSFPKQCAHLKCIV